MSAITKMIEILEVDRSRMQRELKSCYERLATAFSHEDGPMWSESSSELEWKILRAKIELLDESIRVAKALAAFETGPAREPGSEDRMGL